MPKAILRETVTFSTAADLYERLGKLDPAFRSAARLIDWDVDYEQTYSGTVTTHNSFIFEADVSP